MFIKNILSELFYLHT